MIKSTKQADDKMVAKERPSENTNKITKEKRIKKKEI